MRKIRLPRGWPKKFNNFPQHLQAEIADFLTRARFNPRDPGVIGPSVTKLDSHARCETTLHSGHRVLWTVGSYENQEIIDLFDVLPPK